MWREIAKQVAVIVREVRPDQWIALGSFLASRLEALAASDPPPAGEGGDA